MLVELAGATWTGVGERPLVVVPVGSTEQHGPHLPFATDTIVATAVARGAAEALPQEVVVAPALAFGSSGEHQSFPGTVSIGREALHLVVLELARSLATWAGRVVLVNGHGGNAPTLVSAVAQLIAEGHDIAWAPCAPLSSDRPGGRVTAVASAPGDGRIAGATTREDLPAPDAHAGFWETSLMLHLQPASVRTPLPPAGDVRPMSELLPELTASGVRAVSPSGILGDPTGATAARGAAIFDALVDALTTRIVEGTRDANGMLRA
ncbi:mycofactocin biosynthesis peptidyl-dipeptidase MftE [Herbiconiux sp. A18JL235]|uniref:Mycofactocin biosynthesis peptidyl-dipeptidase MftE n=1 Tax=Herbiconiux sp. A18JL235 TaxID=3152363 RepID=A0AB39BE26_9MICO